MKINTGGCNVKYPDGCVMGYDAYDNVRLVTYPNGYEAIYDYDGQGHCIHYKDSCGFEVWTEYDEYGNKIHMVDSYGIGCWYNYSGDEITQEEYDRINT